MYCHHKINNKMPLYLAIFTHTHTHTHIVSICHSFFLCPYFSFDFFSLLFFHHILRKHYKISFIFHIQMRTHTHTHTHARAPKQTSSFIFSLFFFFFLKKKYQNTSKKVFHFINIIYLITLFYILIRYSYSSLFFFL